MNLSSISISPPVLFFVLGAVAALVKSNLRVPKAVTKLMSLYLLWAIGFTGGVKIAQSGVTRDALVATAIGIALSAAMPVAAAIFYSVGASRPIMERTVPSAYPLPCMM